MEHPGPSWNILEHLKKINFKLWNTVDRVLITQSVWVDWLPQIGDTCGRRRNLELISSTRGSPSDWIVPDINYLDRSLRDCCPGHRGVLTKSILEHKKRSVRHPLQLPWDVHLGAHRGTRARNRWPAKMFQAVLERSHVTFKVPSTLNDNSSTISQFSIFRDR